MWIMVLALIASHAALGGVGFWAGRRYGGNERDEWWMQATRRKKAERDDMKRKGFA